MKYALTAKHSLLYCDLSMQGSSARYFRKALGMNYSVPECLIRDHSVFFDYENDTQYNEVLLENRTLNEAIIHFNNSLTKATHHLEKVAEEISISGEMQSHDKKILYRFFRQYYDAFLLNLPFLFRYWNTDYLIITQLKEDFRNIFGKNSEAILQELLIPAYDTYFAKEKRNMQKIISYAAENIGVKRALFQNNSSDSASSLEKYALFNHLVAYHLKQFAFTTTAFYLGKPMEKKDVIERVKMGLENYSIKRTTIERKSLLLRKKWLKVLDIYPEVKERLHLACILMYWKNQRLDVQFKSDYLIHPMLQTIASQMDLSFQQLVHMQYDEILLWFHEGELPSKKEIAKRIRSYSLHLRDGKVTLLTNKKKYPILPSELHVASASSDGVLKGTVAQRGKAVGKVRLVLVSEDIGQVQKGEILVTLMTRPDMIVGMEKAAVFVTDQGGMLSHAAIIAREMRKPCIVGTQNATKVLKTGMLVEVDAVKGIVTKLS